MASPPFTNRARILRTVMNCLLSCPDGLSIGDLELEVRRRLTLDPVLAALVDTPFRHVALWCVPAIKAGLIRVEGNQWLLASSGAKALANHCDPETLLRIAARRSVRGSLAAYLPTAYRMAANAWTQTRVELKALSRMVRWHARGLVSWPRQEWQHALPVQAPRRVDLDSYAAPRTESLTAHLDSLGVAYQAGGHAIYLSPEALAASPFSSLRSIYPQTVGLKILKTPGEAGRASYLHHRSFGDSSFQPALLHSNRHLTLVAALLHLEGLAPRLYDLVEISYGREVWTAFVVDHVQGHMPSYEECRRGVERLRSLDRRGLITTILPDGYDDPEFECPSCAGNALVDDQGQFQYVDFQNFRLGNYGTFLTDLAREASRISHFGDEIHLRGGRYLYQSVPGVRLLAKRDLTGRVSLIRRLIERAGVSLADRLVLDIGCNIGMTMAEYLRLGAMWCHGWDRPEMVLQAQRLLLAVGCTRFSVTGAELGGASSLETDVPLHLKSMLAGCVVSYLAIRGHVGWLPSLARIPWSFMIYEGHEGETLPVLERHVASLQTLVPVSLVAVDSYRDGDSEARIVAVLRRADR
jgi:hypothetical protein